MFITKIKAEKKLKKFKFGQNQLNFRTNLKYIK